MHRLPVVRNQTVVVALGLGLGILVPARARATDFYVDPSAAVTGSGTQTEPWITLETAIADGRIGTDVRAGDTVWLLSGHHGTIAIPPGTYSPAITVAAAPGATPTASSLSFTGASGWVVRGLSISPTYGGGGGGGDLVDVNGSSSDIVVEDCELFSVRDASAWGANEWINVASSGIGVSGDRVTIRNNTLTNVRFGISVDGANALVENNRIIGFSADGLRGLGDYGVFQYNLVKNVYVDDSADSNHDDGFQSWSVGPGGVGTGVVTGVVLRGNFILNREDPNQPLTNSLQGIGCFDGNFEGWVVENNVVVTDHWHGISFYGMHNSRIVNNTVIDVNDVTPGPPWIMVTAHKDGTPSADVIVRNNLATAYDISGNNVTDDHDTTLATSDLAQYFVNPTTFDLHLLPTAPAVDTGSADQAPAIDADRIARPQGAAVDLGAFEWHDGSVTPADGGVGAGGAGAGGLSGIGGATAAGGVGTAGSAAGATGAAQNAVSKDSSGCACAMGRRRTVSGFPLLLGLSALRRLRRSRERLSPSGVSTPTG